jgi:cytochrome P450
MSDLENLDDLLNDEAVNHPASYYAKLRSVSPVYWNPRWNGWIVTGYAEVTQGYRDWKRLSSDRFSGPFGGDIRSAAGEQSQLYNFLSKFFVWKDPPYHTRLRSLVGAALLPRRLDALRVRIRELVRELSEPLVGKNEVEFIDEFAFHLPVIVIAEFLGIPKEARHKVRQWSDDLSAVIFVRGGDSERTRKGEAAMQNLLDFLRPIIHDRRSRPQNDLISAMTAAEHEGLRLTEDEILAAAVLMVFGGHETTMNLLANGVVAFHKFPGEWQRLRGQPELVGSAVEEILRYDGPIRGQARWATEAFTLGDKTIGYKDRVFLIQAAANHDAAIFQDPDKLDITRSRNRHAAFGLGIHTCLGAALARMEAQEAFRYFAEKFDRLEVLGSDLRYNANLVSRSLQGLKVRFHSNTA